MTGVDQPAATRALARRLFDGGTLGAVVGTIVALATWLSGRIAGGSVGGPALVDLVSVLAAGGIALGAFIALALPLRLEASSAPTLDERIDHLARSLRQASAAVVDIEREISARRRLATELAQEAATHQEILATRREEVEAVAELLRAELQQSGRRALRDQVILGFVFFVLGSVVSVVVTVAFM